MYEKADYNWAIAREFQENFTVVNVAGDGNCFYRALSVLLGSHSNQYKMVKDMVADYIK